MGPCVILLDGALLQEQVCFYPMHFNGLASACTHGTNVKVYSRATSQTAFCAGKSGHSTCNGDSGGPLVCPDENGNGKLAGLVSFGYTGCTDAGVFTKVSDYEAWIQDHLVSST